MSSQLESPQLDRPAGKWWKVAWWALLPSLSVPMAVCHPAPLMCVCQMVQQVINHLLLGYRGFVLLPILISREQLVLLLKTGAKKLLSTLASNILMKSETACTQIAHNKSPLKESDLCLQVQKSPRCWLSPHCWHLFCISWRSKPSHLRCSGFISLLAALQE